MTTSSENHCYVNAAGSQSTYSCWFSFGANGLGHLAKDLVAVSGCVSGSLDLLFSHFLAVDVEFDAGGGYQDMELQRKREEEEEKRRNRRRDFIATFFVPRPSLVSGFYPDGLQTIRLCRACDCLCCSSVYLKHWWNVREENQRFSLFIQKKRLSIKAPALLHRGEIWEFKYLFTSHAVCS